MAQINKRIIGMGFDGKPIYAPKHAHSLLLSAAGGGKTTCGAVPWLQSLIADTARAIVITDSKEGEIAAQCAYMCAKYGRKVAIIDDFNVLDGVFGDFNPIAYRSIVLAAWLAHTPKTTGELIFSSENACQALIEGPPKSKPAGKQRTRYKPTGRKSPGPKSFVDLYIEARRAKEKMQAPGCAPADPNGSLSA